MLTDRVYILYVTSLIFFLPVLLFSASEEDVSFSVGVVSIFLLVIKFN